MPPLLQQNLRKLVRKLGANSQPGEQAQALAVIRGGGYGGTDLHFLAAIVAVGAIPLLVPLLGPGSPAEVQELAAIILTMLAGSTDANRVAIAAAGASPLLLQLMGASASPLRSRCKSVQQMRYLCSLGMLRMRPAFLQLVLSLGWCSFWILEMGHQL
jgi:hypothetical protein